MGAAGAEGRVGPNAILQSRDALEALGGPDLAARIFASAGLAPMLTNPPHAMVPVADAAALHHAIARELPPEEARRVARDGGQRTGRYILAHRIPQPAQRLLQVLPARLAGPLLLVAIRKHAWTFAAGAPVICASGRPMLIEIEGNPLAQPGCPWHRAVFETLFHHLVSDRLEVSHPACCATGAHACRFEIAPPLG